MTAETSHVLTSHIGLTPALCYTKPQIVNVLVLTAEVSHDLQLDGDINHESRMSAFLARNLGAILVWGIGCTGSFCSFGIRLILTTLRLCVLRRVCKMRLLPELCFPGFDYRPVDLGDRSDKHSGKPYRLCFQILGILGCVATLLFIGFHVGRFTVERSQEEINGYLGQYTHTRVTAISDFSYLVDMRSTMRTDSRDLA
jgi:hypothetical protein